MLSLTSKLSPLLALMAIHRAAALDAAGWRSQSIYQLLTDRFATDNGSTPICDPATNTYCGGTWKGITSKLDYIQNLGATAIWISPIVKNVEGNIPLAGEAYHGFWTQDLYSLNPHFGTEADLLELSAALHARGMYLMIDIAPNHVGLTIEDGNYSDYIPFNETEYFHDECNIIWNNPTSERLCWLQGLPDLRTEDAGIRQVYAEWIKDIVTKYSIDGIRVDTALEIEPEFWTEGGVREAAGVYMLAEINHSSPDILAPYQQYLDGYIDFSSWNWFTEAFQRRGATLSDLYNGTNWLAAMTNIDPSLFGSFVENHDQVRFPYRNSDMSLAKTIASAAMLRDGIPIVYYGQEQHYNGGAVPMEREALWWSGYDINSEMYGWIQQTNKVRAAAAAADPDFYTTRTKALFYRDSTATSSNVIAMRKGQLMTMFSNGGLKITNSVQYSIQRALHEYAIGSEVIDVLNCESFTVASHGRLWVQMPATGLPRAFLPADQAAGLCNNVTAFVNTAPTNLAVDKS